MDHLLHKGSCTGYCDMQCNQDSQNLLCNLVLLVQPLLVILLKKRAFIFYSPNIRINIFKVILLYYLQRMQPSLPFPVKPCWHVHAMSCTVVEQMAFAPHLNIKHALMQDPVWQTSDVRHSWFELHWGTAVTAKVKCICF